MKVYYIGSGYDGCFYVRCLVPMSANGWWGEKTSLGSPEESAQQKTRAVMDADVIVFQRPMDNARYEMAKMLKNAGKVIVYDNDDTYRLGETPKVMIASNEVDVDSAVKKIDSNLKKFADLADLITVSTPTLATEYDKDKTIVLKNYVEPYDWPTPLKNHGDKIRIGMVGSVVSEDYHEIKDVLKTISDDDRFQLVVFGMPPKKEAYKIQNEIYKDEYAFWESLNIEWQPQVPTKDYIDTLNELRLDISLIPRKETYFNKCKSNIKFLEMSMLEIPCVASDFEDSPYRQDAPYCLLAGNWLNLIYGLLDKGVREKIGQEAKKYVIKNYNINDHADEWEKAYASVLTSN